MRLRKRRLLLLCMAVFFFLAGGYLTMLAQGWVLDITHLKIVKTGSLFFEFSPQDAKITIQGKPIRLSFGILSSGALVKNLIPGTYSIEIAKNGLFPWKKNLVIESGKVTSATHIILWQAKPNEKPIDKSSINSFWVAENAIITKKDNNLFIAGTQLKGVKVIATRPESKLVITEDDSKNYYLINLESPTALSNITELFNSLKQSKLGLPGKVAIKFIAFHPFSENKLVLGTENAVYLLDTSKIDIEPVINLPHISAIALSQNEAFAINSSGTITSFNLAIRKGGTVPFRVPEVVQIIASKNGKYLALIKTEGELLVLDREKSSFTFISDKISYVDFSPENKRIGYVTKDHQLAIYNLESFGWDSKYVSGEILNIGKGGGAENFAWMSEFPNYVLVFGNNKLAIQEIDKREPINRYILRENVKKYVYSGKNLYFSDQANHLLLISF